MNLDQAVGSDLADVYRAFIADTSRLRYGPADLGHSGGCDHDGGCRSRAVAAVISASHADCVCGGGCGRTPASLAFLCADHVAEEPIASKDAAEYRADDVEGVAARAVWSALLAVHPAPLGLPGVEERTSVSANPEDGTPELWAEEVELMAAAMPPVVAGQPDPYAADQAADAKRVQRDQLAQETAEYIATELNPLTERAAQMPGCSIVYPDGQKPPTDVEEIKATLLDGRLWISWMDDRVFAAMRAMHRGYDEHRAIGEAVGFHVNARPE